MGRDREHLTELEVQRLIKAARGNRHGHRDATMILIGFRHGLRVSELCGLQWASIEFETGTIHVRRAKGGEAATHPLLGDELRALRELKRQSPSPFVFASERGGPFTPSGFAKLLGRAGDEAKIGFKVHPHMLPHACGYALPKKASIPERCKRTSGIARSIRPRAMPHWRRGGLRTSGGRRRVAGRLAFR
jgi:type 1 fimbriae regulatory protein FimB/type 1 fimbriae regulatory protein FimE